MDFSSRNDWAQTAAVGSVLATSSTPLLYTTREPFHLRSGRNPLRRSESWEERKKMRSVWRAVRRRSSDQMNWVGTEGNDAHVVRMLLCCGKSKGHCGNCGHCGHCLPLPVAKSTSIIYRIDCRTLVEGSSNALALHHGSRDAIAVAPPFQQ